MKKVLLISFLFFILISNVSASTSSASSYVLMDMNTGRVLKSKKKDDRRLIASITKIMTAIVAIESNRLDEEVVVDESINKAYGSGIYIQIGEKLTLRDLLYGLMLRSGNDAALMISNFVSESEEEFVEKMNKKAQEIGMKNTTFINSSGLDDDSLGNYSTSYDMALLTSYAMKNKSYRDIVSTKKYTLKTNYKTYIWHNKNKLLSESYITGGKTGYTKKAGRTLVTTASRDNMNLVAVTLRDGDDWNTHRDLYQYAFDNYESYKVLSKTKFALEDDYYDGNFYIKNDLYIPLKKNEVNSLVNHIKLNKIKNYQNNSLVGVNEIIINNKVIAKENIYIKKNKKKKEKNIFNKIKEFLL